MSNPRRSRLVAADGSVGCFLSRDKAANWCGDEFAIRQGASRRTLLTGKASGIHQLRGRATPDGQCAHRDAAARQEPLHPEKILGKHRASFQRCSSVSQKKSAVGRPPVDINRRAKGVKFRPVRVSAAGRTGLPGIDSLLLLTGMVARWEKKLNHGGHGDQ
jgi:hypothetical protein